MLRPIIARNYDPILCVSCDTARKIRGLSFSLRPQDRKGARNRHPAIAAAARGWSDPV